VAVFPMLVIMGQRRSIVSYGQVFDLEGLVVPYAVGWRRRLCSFPDVLDGWSGTPHS